MDIQYKNIIKYCKKAMTYEYMSYFLIVLALIFAGIGLADNSKSVFDKPYFIISICLIVLWIVTHFANSYYFHKKVKKMLKDIEVNTSQLEDVLNKCYFFPIYSWGSLMRIFQNAVNETEIKRFNEMQNENTKGFIQTERLILRHFEDKDLDFVYQYRNNPEINVYQTYDCFSKEDILKMFLENSKKDIFDSVALFAVALKETDEIIGEFFISNTLVSKEYFMGFTIGKEFQRQGYASEMIDELMVHVETKKPKTKFICTAYKKNIKSIGLLKKLDFKSIGNLSDEKGEIIIFEKRFN